MSIPWSFSKLSFAQPLLNVFFLLGMGSFSSWKRFAFLSFYFCCWLAHLLFDGIHLSFYFALQKKKQKEKDGMRSRLRVKDGEYGMDEKS